MTKQTTKQRRAQRQLDEHATNERRKRYIELIGTLSATLNELHEVWAEEIDVDTEMAVRPQRHSLAKMLNTHQGAGLRLPGSSFLALHVEEWKIESTTALRGLVKAWENTPSAE